MAEQKQYRPSRRPSDNDGLGSDGRFGSPRRSSGSDALERANSALDNIDSALAENDRFRDSLSSGGDNPALDSAGAPKSKSFNPDTLASAENNAENPGATAGENAEKKDGENLFHDDAPGEKQSRARALFKKKRGIGIGIIGIGLGGGFGLMSILHGPGQLIQLGQILSKLSRTHDSSIKVRLNSLTRTARAAATGDIGETRVTFLGSRRFRAVETRLKSVGIEFERRTQTGRPTALNIEAERNPTFRGKPPAQTRIAIATFYDIDPANVKFDGAKYSIDMSNLTTKSARSLSFTNLNHLEDGRVLSSMNKRVMAKFFRIPSLFHPLERTATNIENRLYGRAARLAEEEGRKNTRRAKLKEKYTTAREKLKQKVDPHRRAIGATLLVTAGMCLAKDFAELIPLVNYSEVVAPSMIEATDKQAIGSQIQKNQDFDLHTLGNVSHSLVDEDGRSVWESKPLNALATNTEGEGVDIEDEYRQAFSTHTSKNGFLAGLEQVGSGGGGFVGELFSDLACSAPGRVAQAVAGVVLIVTGPGGWAAKAASAGTSTVATMAAIKLVQKLFVTNFSAGAIKSFAGPHGGSLLAFGARASHALNARSMGGIALKGTEKRVALDEIEQSDREEFRNRSFFARMFDLEDYRSLASYGLRTAAIYEARGLPSIVAKLNPFSMMPTGLSSFSSKVAAEGEEGYDWTSPLYSVPMRILTDERFEDPYNNAEVMAGVFNNNPASDYVKRAKHCFGVDIKKGAHGWDAIQVEDVNPTDDEYVEAQCDNLSDDNWTRTMLFVFDTTIVTGVDCYAGGEESCKQIFTGGSSGVQSTVSGDVQSLAKQLLANPNVTYWNNNNVNTRDVVVALSQGKQAYTTCSNASNKTADINPNIMKFLVEAGQKTNIMVNALTDKCHSNGSKHYSGEAVDLDLANSGPLDIIGPIATKYNGSKNNETTHHHFTFDK